MRGIGIDRVPDDVGIVAVTVGVAVGVANHGRLSRSGVVDAHRNEGNPGAIQRVVKFVLASSRCFR